VLRVLVLGAAAGGGFPQWNGNDHASRQSRAGDSRYPPLTQSSIAVSGDGLRWVVVNASPDLRQQINERQQLHPAPNAPRRASPISAVVLTNADVDHVAGLLTLRESHPVALYAHPETLAALRQNPIFEVLNPNFVERRPLLLDEEVSLKDIGGKPLGINIECFAVPGKVPLWLEETIGPDLSGEIGQTIGVEIRAEGSPSVFYVPNCSAMTAALANRLTDAEVVFFDGTLWRDDELLVAGVGTKTGLRMGHMSCFGHDGSMAALECLNIKRKIFVHINNTNPLLDQESSERCEAQRAGWEIAYDGMELTL